MAPLYNFGLSQEDPLTEARGLELADGDSLLCIAGAGEVPLSISAMNNVAVVAVDASENQLRLCRIKQQAAIHLPVGRAAGFLGYTAMPGNRREEIFEAEISRRLIIEDRDFWKGNIGAIRRGVINEGKFERFIRKASLPARMVIGKKNFYRLFECSSTPEQEDVFDRYFAGILLKTVFKTVFHPRVYKNRGIDAAGMQHRSEGNIGDFFFNRFRNFCCSTPARDNFLLQYVFFRQSLFPSALPEYLKDEHHDAFLRHQHGVSFVPATMESYLPAVPHGQFNKIQLSNISDWISRETMAGLFGHIQEKTEPGTRVVMRYIYLEHPIPQQTPFLQPDRKLGDKLIQTDRFPFSSVSCIQHTAHEQLPYQAD